MTKATCHPNRKHYAKGLCASCYHAQAKKKKAHKHKEPVMVTHTHEVIRQVQQQKKNNTMTAAANAESKKGHSGGIPGEEGYPPPKYVEKLPEGTVISPLGVTRPPEVGIQDPYRKERSDDEQLAGKVLVKGKTHHGFTYERIVDILQPRTERGMFQVFKAHFPDAVEENFSAEAISDEDAIKLEKEWADELRNQEKEKRDKRAKEYEESTAKSAKEKEKSG